MNACARIPSAALCLALALAAAGAGGLTLREAYSNDFLVGVALNAQLTPPADPAAEALIADNFSAVVAENAMKAGPLQPREGVFNFTDADRLVAFAERHGLKVTGHTLVWHSQAPGWFFTGPGGAPATRELLLARMRAHIFAVVGRYRGRVLGWDVVNEAFEGDGSYRRSPYYEIIGPDYIEQAFRFAHEADPAAECYYNDYGMDAPGKRARVVRLVGELRAKGLRIDAVGMQTHVSLTAPDLREYEASLEAFAAAGVKVMATEMDVTVLPWAGGERTADIAARADYRARFDPYRAGLPPEVSRRLAERYAAFFALFLRHRGTVSRVTLWGLYDGASWLNSFPVRGRTDYPLLFDRSLRPKPCLDAILRLPRPAGG